MTYQPEQEPQANSGGATPAENQPGFGEAPDAPPAQQPYGQQQGPPAQQPYGQPGYGQVPYGQLPYGQQGYGSAPANTGSKGLSIASMVVGIVSLIGLGFLMIPSIAGIVLGHLGMVKEKPQGKVFSLVGLITSYLALVIYGVIWIAIIIATASARNSTYSNY